MAAEWAVTEEALAAMEAAGSAMEEATEQIKADIAELESAFEENESGLGAHSADISALIEELQQIGEEAGTPVKKLTLKLTRSIVIRRAHIEQNSYSQGRSR